MAKQIGSGKYKPFISVIIPVEEETAYLKEAIDHYSLQTYKNFELIISSTAKIRSKYKFVKNVVDKRLKNDVSSKRNKIIRFGKGEIFVFNDDDVFVPKTYLKTIIKLFEKKGVIAACGPLLTPPNDDFLQKSGGAVWESYLGSLGAGIYRSRRMPSRTVYDYPAANLIVRSDVFKRIGGFEKGLFPGEDTKFCLMVLGFFQKGIYYDSRLLAYHHRKSLFKSHLMQIGRYGTQRGWFSLSYPTTSRQIQYFLPTIFLLYLSLLLFFEVSSFFTLYSLQFNFLFIPLLAYIVFLLIDGTIIIRRHNVWIAALAMLGIILTHLYYGFKFVKSFIRKLVSKFASFLNLF